MLNIKENIDNQIRYNRGKNLFNSNLSSLFQFVAETKKIALQYKETDSKNEKLLIDYATQNALEEFYRVNQYYSFDKAAKVRLKTIYSDLFQSLKQENDIDKIASIHYKKLKTWLTETNPFAEQIYKKSSSMVECVVCNEYSPQLQIELLKINLSHLVEPVLDIGCGKSAALVKHLQSIGIDTFGFDRMVQNENYCSQFDWFEYHFENNKWGTIISNLGFSNHFAHHHFRKDGDYVRYAKKYMEILHSLKKGGSFYYAPGLSFIEEFLDNSIFEVNNHPVNQTGYDATSVKKL
ncbi:class I SAM-dependent methyltransferase [Maribellus comscasis]|uniref:Class I SAM-dependent methyltransferase n=1 Tax=Maribellus comscasis TaxID=2681766 RepID=A0A6I6K071_9BACT|nr:class I SAM-dependent methyltransferase [Maribellus comscasis]QGY46840.1 class I SAM-dependent methyltransferase [Maribellus comscasis]